MTYAILNSPLILLSSSLKLLAFTYIYLLLLIFLIPWSELLLTISFPVDIFVSLCILARLVLFLLVLPSFGCDFDIVWRFCWWGAWPYVKRLWIVFFFRRFKTNRDDLRWIVHRWDFLNRTILHKCYFVFWLIYGYERWVFNWCLRWEDFEIETYQKMYFLSC